MVTGEIHPLKVLSPALLPTTSAHDRNHVSPPALDVQQVTLDLSVCYVLVVTVVYTIVATNAQMTRR